MAKFSLSIDCGNSAFGEVAIERASEIERILREVGAQLVNTAGWSQERNSGVIRDANGNRVGAWQFERKG